MTPDLIERLEAAGGCITELERQLKVAREALDCIFMEDRRIVERWRQSLATGDSHLDEQIVLGRYAEIARQALANMEQADD